MPLCRFASHSLDVGHQTFESFLDERLDVLKVDLLRECNRIAAARELVVQRKLDDTCRQNVELQEKLGSVAKRAAEGVAQLGRDCNDEPIDDTMALQTAGITATLNLELELEDQLIPSADNAVMSEQFTLWREFEDVGHEDHKDYHKRVSESWDMIFSSADPGHANSSCCTINPHSREAICWEVIGVPILFYDLVTIPLHVFWEFEEVVFEAINWMIILYWTVDIFLRLFVIGYVSKEGIVDRRRKVIIKGYLRTKFGFDFLMVLPDWCSKIIGARGLRNVGVLRLFRIMRLMRLMRIKKVKNSMRDLEDLIDSEYVTVGISIFANLFTILGACHYLGCCWFWLGSWETAAHFYDKSWVEVQNLQDADWWYQYAISFHWSLVQFTPGSSKIRPSNVLEQLAEIAALIFGLVSMSAFITAFLQARLRMQALSSKMDKDNWILRRYLRQQGVSTDLQIRTMRYVEKCLEPMETRMQSKDVNLLPRLSRPLQLELQQEQYFQTLIAHPFFKILRMRSFGLTLHLFVNVIIEVLLASSDLLFEDGSISHEMYFVSRGALAYLSDATDRMQSIGVGGWCSEPILWVAWVHVGTAKAAIDSHVISIDSAKMRAGVVEHKERSYAGRCARAYVKDLRAFLNAGGLITDTTQITSDETSAYMGAIYGEADRQDVTNHKPVEASILGTPS